VLRNVAYGTVHPEIELQELPAPTSPGGSGSGSARLSEYYFEYRFFRFIYNPATERFFLVANLPLANLSNMNGARAGISSDVLVLRSFLFGRNEIDIKEKSVWALLVEEIIHPFVVFQIASMILWIVDDYWVRILRAPFFFFLSDDLLDFSGFLLS
jgi:hypothetical protein